jgi:hypothetical protein
LFTASLTVIFEKFKNVSAVRAGGFKDSLTIPISVILSWALHKVTPVEGPVALIGFFEIIQVHVF